MNNNYIFFLNRSFWNYLRSALLIFHAEAHELYVICKQMWVPDDTINTNLFLSDPIVFKSSVTYEFMAELSIHFLKYL